jgi:hypothetical protein
MLSPELGCIHWVGFQQALVSGRYPAEYAVAFGRPLKLAVVRRIDGIPRVLSLAP